MQEIISNLIKNACEKLSLEVPAFSVEHPNDLSHGDYATNIALIIGKKIGKSPQEVSVQIKSEIDKALPDTIEKVEIAGPGFINFYLSSKFFTNSIQDIVNEGERFGRNDSLAGQLVVCEYTTQNLFKVMHVGHLMSNTIGEALACLAEANGASVARTNYQGDIGLHVAKAVWGMKQNLMSLPKNDATVNDRSSFIGKCYAFGNNEYEVNEDAKKEIIDINKKLFAKSNIDLNDLYNKGRMWSLEAFDVMYNILGTNFYRLFFESETVDVAIKTVKEGLSKGIFEESDGAIVYKGEKKGLHTRVFLNKHGLPTYEAKELGLAQIKAQSFDANKFIIITGNEQKEYMKVVHAVLEDIFPDIYKKTEHITHGFLRLVTGKMSSRTGNIISADSIIMDVSSLVEEKMKDSEIDPVSKITTVLNIAVAAIKYSILRQALGKDIVFDFDKSISFEGDSGPYLQYTCSRANSILKKAEAEAVSFTGVNKPADWQTTLVEKLLYQFPEVVKIAYYEKSPHKLITYLTELSSAFNSFYGSNKIVDKNDPASGYKVMLSQAVKTVLENGLIFVGMPVARNM